MIQTDLQVGAKVARQSRGRWTHKEAVRQMCSEWPVQQMSHLRVAVSCSAISTDISGGTGILPSTNGQGSTTSCRLLQSCGCPHRRRAQGTCHTALAGCLLRHTLTHNKQSATCKNRRTGNKHCPCGLLCCLYVKDSSLSLPHNRSRLCGGGGRT